MKSGLRVVESFTDSPTDSGISCLAQTLNFAINGKEKNVKAKTRNFEDRIRNYICKKSLSGLTLTFFFTKSSKSQAQFSTAQYNKDNKPTNQLPRKTTPATKHPLVATDQSTHTTISTTSSTPHTQKKWPPTKRTSPHQITTTTATPNYPQTSTLPRQT